MCNNDGDDNDNNDDNDSNNNNSSNNNLRSFDPLITNSVKSGWLKSSPFPAVCGGVQWLFLPFLFLLLCSCRIHAISAGSLNAMVGIVATPPTHTHKHTVVLLQVPEGRDDPVGVLLGGGDGGWVVVGRW